MDLTHRVDSVIALDRVEGLPMATGTSLKRSELYRLVWQQPMLRLAKSYGLSDVGLAKICRKHDIPRPPRGYWAKKEHGKAPAQIPLPKPERDETIDLRDNGHPTPTSPAVRQHVVETTAGEQQPQMRIEVAETLRGSHKLVSRANQQLTSARTDRERIIIKPPEPVLDVSISKASLRRALLIMDALLKALDERGYEVDEGPTVRLLGVTVQFSMREQLETHREQPSEHDLDGPYTFGHSRFDVKRVPSGRLCLIIEQEAGGCQRTWRDTERRQLEERLNDFVIGLSEIAAVLKGREDQRRRQAELRRQEAERQAEIRRQEEARRQEEQRRREEHRRRYEAELSRVNQLLDQAECYRQSRLVRELIDAVRKAHAADGPIEPGSEVERWIEWTTQQADRLDPLQPSPPSILDEDPDHFEQS